MEWIEARPGNAVLKPDEVHVWRFRLAEATTDLAAALSIVERDRAAQMASEKARLSFVGSQSALRKILSGYVHAPPQTLEFTRGAHGKPMLAGDAEPQFNVSHSGDWGLVAVAPFAVGVDVEQVREQRALPALQKRFLADGERDLIGRLSQSRGDAAFFIVWSRKEAYLKAAGFGLAAPLSRVDSSADRLTELDETGAQIDGDTPWTARELVVDHRHPATVVARARHITLRLFTLGRDQP